MVDSGFLPDAARIPRIAPTEHIDAHRAPLETPAARASGMIRGQVHDPRAFRLGGVAGNAGLFSTARDLSRYARMLLSGGTLDGARVLSAASVASMTAPQRAGDAVRGLGWDIHSHYSGLRGHQLSERAFGHGGFTGVSLWVDPGQDLFVVFLSNRVHPDGRGYVIPLVGAVTDQIVQQLRTAAPNVPVPTRAAPTPSAASDAGAQLCNPLRGPVSTGIDVLRADAFTPLAGRVIGLVVNNASRARDGTSTLELFRKQTTLQLKALFAAEHGLASSAEGAIANGASQGLPVYSLFGKTRRPTPEMLRGLDTIVFDLADVGTRFYTYLSTLRHRSRRARSTQPDRRRRHRGARLLRDRGKLRQLSSAARSARHDRGRTRRADECRAAHRRAFARLAHAGLHARHALRSDRADVVRALAQPAERAQRHLVSGPRLAREHERLGRSGN
jgi:hypothetical protein